MKLDYTAVLNNLDGTPFITNQAVLDEKGNVTTPAVHLTLKDAILSVFSAQHKDDEALSPLEKFNLGRIAHAVSKDLSLPLVDLEKVKDRLGKCLVSPALVFAAWNLIDPTEDATTPDPGGKPAATPLKRRK